MANRFPLIFNSGAGQIQELAASDNLDLTSSNLVNAGILFTSSGSATAPSLQIGSGTTYNPGLYSPGTDQLAISTNGTGRLFVASDGKVGVGTSSPLQLLDVRGNAQVGLTGENFLNIRSTSGNGQFLFLTESGIADRWLLGSPASSGDLVFRSGAYDFATGTERMRLDSSGRLGIGTSGPDASSMITVLNATTASYRAQNNVGGAAIFGVSDSASSEGFINASNAFRFKVDGTTRASLTATGLGIGTTSPTQALTVGSGNAQITSGQFAVGVLGTSGLQFINDGTIGTVDSNPLILRTVATERARIDTSGRLLVGTSTSTGSGFVQVQGSTASYTATGLISLRRGSLPTTSNQGLGAIYFEDNSGNLGASIFGFADGSWTSGTNHRSRLVFSTTLDGAATPTEALRITNDLVIAYNQPTPTSKSAAATLTIAELKTGIIQYTGAVATLTLPTGTLMEGGFAGIYTNMAFEWSVINTGAGICTVAAGTAHTVVGSGAVAISASARFVSRRTAANTFVSYSLS